MWYKKILIFLVAFLSFLAVAHLVSAKILTIHTGSYSLDRNNLTKGEINAQVDAIVSAMPNTTHIAIGTYLDYPTQIQLWTNAIHKKGKKVFFRSAGTNSWQGRNSVAAYTGSDFAEKQQASFMNFLNSNKWMFRGGDNVECVPDEPENGPGWKKYYGSFANASASAAFNDFLQDALYGCQTIFAGTGVETGYVFTNPSMTKDILSASTAALLVATGQDVYPERVSGIALTSPTDMAQALQDQLNTWVLPAHPEKPKHITFGPSVWTQLTQQQQADTYDLYFPIITTTLINLDGVTIWQAGANDNAGKSRLFEYNSGAWQPRQATSIINYYFGK